MMSVEPCCCFDCAFPSDLLHLALDSDSESYAHFTSHSAEKYGNVATDVVDLYQLLFVFDGFQRNSRQF